MKSGGYLALVNPCGEGHLGPQSSSSDLESSARDQFGRVEVDSDQLSDDSDDKKSNLKRSLTLHQRIKSKMER